MTTFTLTLVRAWNVRKDKRPGKGIAVATYNFLDRLYHEPV